MGEQPVYVVHMSASTPLSFKHLKQRDQLDDLWPTYYRLFQPKTTKLLLNIWLLS